MFKKMLFLSFGLGLVLFGVTTCGSPTSSDQITPTPEVPGASSLEVLSTSPVDGETGTGVTRVVTATFSGEVNPSTVIATNFTLIGPSGALAGEVTYVDNVVTFTPTADLATDATYTGTISTALKDLAGNVLAANYVWSFKTAHGVTVGPTGDYHTIQAAIDAAAPGDTIKVSAGTYDETINISKRVAIIGAGSGGAGTVLINTATQSNFSKLPNVEGVTYGAYRPNVIVSVSGMDSNNPVLLKDILIIPGPNIGYPRPAILPRPGASGASISYSYIELSNVRIIGDTSHDSSGTVGPPVIAPVSANTRGVTIDGRTNLRHLLVKNCEFSDMTYGMVFYNNEVTPTNVQDVMIINTTFARNVVKGFYAEKLSDATFTNAKFIDNGIASRAPYYWTWTNAGLDVTLKYGVFKNLVFNNLTVTGNGIDSVAGAGLTVKARGTGNDDPLLHATLVGVKVMGGTFTGNMVRIRFGEVQSAASPTLSLQNTSPTDITVNGATVSGNSGGNVVNYVNGVSIGN